MARRREQRAFWRDMIAPFSFEKDEEGFQHTFSRRKTQRFVTCENKKDLRVYAHFVRCGDAAAWDWRGGEMTVLRLILDEIVDAGIEEVCLVIRLGDREAYQKAAVDLVARLPQVFF